MEPHKFSAAKNRRFQERRQRLIISKNFFSVKFVISFLQ